MALEQYAKSLMELRIRHRGEAKPLKSRIKRLIAAGTVLKGVAARGKRERLICDPCLVTVRKDMAVEFELRWRVRALGAKL